MRICAALRRLLIKTAASTQCFQFLSKLPVHIISWNETEYTSLTFTQQNIVQGGCRFGYLQQRLQVGMWASLNALFLSPTSAFRQENQRK